MDIFNINMLDYILDYLIAIEVIWTLSIYISTIVGNIVFWTMLYNSMWNLYKRWLYNQYNQMQQNLNDNSTNIRKAIRNNDKDKVKELLNSGVNIDERSNKNQRTALMWAVRNKNIRMTKFLIKRGADVNLFDNLLNTPLHFAGQGFDENLTIVKMLVENGANINFINVNGLPPITFYRDPQIFQYLIDNNANINLKNNNKSLLYHLCRTDYIELVKIMLINGAVIDEESKFHPLVQIHLLKLEMQEQKEHYENLLSNKFRELHIELNTELYAPPNGIGYKKIIERQG